MIKIKLKEFVSRIEFWIIIFFIIRLIGITNPPLEIAHNWRQITGLMVSRNFLEIDNNILYPRIDDNSCETGIIGMEFPIMNYLYYFIAKLFGYTHWYGRLINLFISSFGILFYYKIIKKYINPNLALISSLILMSSIWFSFSRKMMPDTFCISLIFIALYYGLQFLYDSKIKNLIIYIIVSSLAVLSKIPAIIYLVVFIIPLFSNKIIYKNKLIFSFSSLISISISYIWYFKWNEYLSKTFGNWYNTGSNIGDGINEIFSNYALVLKEFYFNSFYSYLFFVIFIIGLAFIFIKKEKVLIYIFLSVSFIFFLFMIKSGKFFYINNYYIIPYVPIMSLVAAYFLSIINKKQIVIFIMLIGISESIINQHHDFFIKKNQLYKLELENISDSISSPNDLIAINSDGNPQLLYLTHRKGWLIKNVEISDSLFIKNLISKNCKYLFINKKSLETKFNFRIIYENTNFIVYKLSD